VLLTRYKEAEQGDEATPNAKSCGRRGRVANGLVVGGNRVIGHLTGVGNHRAVDNVVTTTTCMRYFPSVLSCQASLGHAKRSESCSGPQRPPPAI
jgi:hypothetical protein